MKITPERVLELAALLESGEINVVDMDGVLVGKADADIMQALRWAAGVMKASPMATIKEDEGCKYLHFDEYRPEDWQLDAELIIKPEPSEV